MHRQSCIKGLGRGGSGKERVSGGEGTSVIPLAIKINCKEYVVNDFPILKEWLFNKHSPGKREYTCNLYVVFGETLDSLIQTIQVALTMNSLNPYPHLMGFLFALFF